MSSSDKKHSTDRRALLKGLAVAGTAATAAAAGAATVVTRTEQPAATESAPQSKGYRLTPHVQEYYRKARF